MRPKNVRSNLLAFTFVKCLLAIGLNGPLASSAHAFKILSPAIHEEITLAALNASVLANSIKSDAPNWDFTSVAKAQIIAGNISTDLLTRFGTKPDTEVWHFDNSEITAGAELVLLVRAEIISLIREADTRYRSGNKPRGDKISKDARFLTGTILHTIQDFYSHSNWVETGRSGLAGMIWYRGPKTNPFVGERRGSCICGSPLSLQDNGLTSAYFFDRGILTGYEWDDELAVEAVVQGKCIHNATHDEARVASFCGNLVDNPWNYQQYPILPGTDKDAPGRPWSKRESESRSLHELAKDTAVLASSAFLQGVLLEARDAGLYQGICGFLGFSTTADCNFSYSPGPYDIQFDFFRIGNTYYTDEAFELDVDLFDSSLGSLQAVNSVWSADFAGTGTCPEDPSTIDSRANQCHMVRALHSFVISTEDPNAAYQWLYCNTGFDEPKLSNPTGRFDVCGLNDLFFKNRGIFDYIEWPGGTQSFARTFETRRRFIAAGYTWCGLCADYVGSPTFTLDGTFISRLTGFLGIDNGPGAEPSSLTGTSPYVEFVGTLTIRLKLTYEYTKLPSAQSGLITKDGTIYE